MISVCREYPKSPGAQQVAYASVDPVNWPPHIHADEFEHPDRLHPDLVAGLAEGTSTHITPFVL